MAINLSTAIGHKAGRIVFHHSLPTLVYFVNDKLACCLESTINGVCVQPPSILNQKNSPSSLIANSCIFCARQADLLPWINKQRSMCYPFINSDTYKFYSVVLFFKLQSINLLLAASKQEEQSFPTYYQLLYILCTTSWLATIGPQTTRYVFSLHQF